MVVILTIQVVSMYRSIVWVAILTICRLLSCIEVSWSIDIDNVGISHVASIVC